MNLQAPRWHISTVQKDFFDTQNLRRFGEIPQAEESATSIVLLLSVTAVARTNGPLQTAPELCPGSRLGVALQSNRTLAELLRDKTLAMVMRYAHLAPDYKLAAVERMAASFSGSETDTKLTPTLASQKIGSSMVQ